MSLDRCYGQWLLVVARDQTQEDGHNGQELAECCHTRSFFSNHHDESSFVRNRNILPDRVAMEGNEAKLGTVLYVYGERLFESKYLGSDCFTLTDLHHLPSFIS